MLRTETHISNRFSEIAEPENLADFASKPRFHYLSIELPKMKKILTLAKRGYSLSYKVPKSTHLRQKDVDLIAVNNL